ncbi:MAG TPA: glycine cleavage system protein H [Usitatibacter sp.]|nr:glycine cleavage system protein H [Usitatibacter sp.]
MTKVRGFEFPDDLWYLVEQDTWARREADGLVTVGITSLGAHISGEFIEFVAKPLGTAIERDRSIGALEMSKVIRSARSPVAGTLVEVNAKVRASPGLINADPYGEGWLARLRPAAWDEDVARLVAGGAVGAAVEDYMSTLVEAFGMDKPPAA